MVSGLGCAGGWWVVARPAAASHRQPQPPHGQPYHTRPRDPKITQESPGGASAGGCLVMLEFGLVAGGWAGLEAWTALVFGLGWWLGWWWLYRVAKASCGASHSQPKPAAASQRASQSHSQPATASHSHPDQTRCCSNNKLIILWNPVEP